MANPNNKFTQFNLNLSSELTNISSRLRMMEERQSNVQRKMHLLEQNMLSNAKELRLEIKILQSEQFELKKTIKDYAQIIDKISNSLQDLATREEVKVIEKYLNLIDPTNFISRKTLENEIKRLLDQKVKKNV